MDRQTFLAGTGAVLLDAPHASASLRDDPCYDAPPWRRLDLVRPIYHVLLATCPCQRCRWRGRIRRARHIATSTSATAPSWAVEIGRRAEALLLGRNDEGSRPSIGLVRQRPAW